MSKSGLNSNAVFEESTATSSSVMLSGARREKEEPEGFAIAEYTTDSRASDSLGAGVVG
jgi:hypothetical protein